MTIALKVPEVGESITDVEIGAWLKAEGDHVERDEDIVVLETEKATLQISAPQPGTITKILKQSGESARVGETIGQLEEGSLEATRPATKEKPIADPAKMATAHRAAEEHGEAATEELRTESIEPVEIVADTKQEEEVDRISEEAERDFVGRSEAGGQSGAYAETKPDGKEEAKPATVRQLGGEADRQPPDAQAAFDLPGSRQAGAERRPEREVSAPTIDRDATGRKETVVRMTPLRRRIAERLVQAQQTSALLSTFNEIDMAAVVALRSRYRDVFQERHQVKLGLMSFFIKATVEALRLVPELNAEIRGDSIVYRSFFDIGVAVGGGKGLVVPVLRNAERLSFAAVEQAIADFVRRAQASRLKPAELEGGTFTISNGGIYGSLLSTPIINPPQSGILGMHAIQERPVVRDGAIVVRPMMYVALTYDHRIVDGREAVTFLKHIKEFIEDPARLLLEA
jgi:2-oxoglutarate dehydrogenase E2 component (dihydrolipoamide succinyltransferase)